MFLIFKRLKKKILKNTESNFHKELVNNISSGETIEIDGKSFKKIKIQVVDSANYRVSTYIDQLETEISFMKSDMEDLIKKSTFLENKIESQSNYIKFLLSERPIRQKNIEIESLKLKLIESENSIQRSKSDFISVVQDLELKILNHKEIYYQEMVQKIFELEQNLAVKNKQIEDYEIMECNIDRIIKEKIAEQILRREQEIKEQFNKYVVFYNLATNKKLNSDDQAKLVLLQKENNQLIKELEDKTLKITELEDRIAVLNSWYNKLNVDF